MRRATDERRMVSGAKRSRAEVHDSARVAAPKQSETSDIRELELRLRRGELDSSTAMTIAESLAHGRPQDVDYASEVAGLLAANLETNRTLDRHNALELAYLTLIQRLLDDGNAEAAQYVAQRALSGIPDSTRIRSALAIALADRLYYREAIVVLRGIQDPDAIVQAQIATLLYRQGDIGQSTRLASEVRGWSAEAAEMMEEIPE